MNTWRRVKRNLHRDRVVPLHLFSGETRSLCGDFQNDGRRIWIRLDVDLLKGKKTAAGKHYQTENNHGSAGQTKCENGFEHGWIVIVANEVLELIGRRHIQHVAEENGSVSYSDFTAL